MVKIAIYTQKCEQKGLKINNRGVGMKISWVEKNRKINNRGGGQLFGTREYVIHSNCARLHNFFFFIMDYGENGYLH